ncbi:MAG: cytochrome b [Pikeienuella sp.]
MSEHKYPAIQRGLHWVIALMVLGTLAVGMLLGWLGYGGVVKSFGQDMTNMLYKYHKTFGVIILFAMIIRIIVKIRMGKPPYANPLTSFEKAASGAVHGLLYVCLLAMPILGWLATSAGGYPVEFFNWTLPNPISKDKELSETLYWLHGAVGWMTAALVAAHIGAALMHGIVKRDGVLQRML